MRVCDYIAEYIRSNGIESIFMVSGGGLMFLTDGLACNKELKKICCHHEQAAAMAAVAYAKYSGMGCAYVTTGCGGTNTMTGVLNAWQDNVPCIFISGQCKRKETLSYVGLPIRQVGVQEADIVELVTPITKYAIMVNEASDIQYHMEKAFYLAKSGRPGPVWIDVPMDVQSAEVNIDELRHFNPVEMKEDKTIASEWEINDLVGEIKRAKRPIIIAGHGIRLSGATDEFYELVHKYQIPVVCSRMGLDVLPTMDDYAIGRIGNKGTRAGNFAVQNADLVIAIGSRLSVSSTGQQYEFFAREAKVIAVDIDKYEHTKNTVHVDRVIVADAKNVISALLNNDELAGFSAGSWSQTCRAWREKYPVCLSEYYDDADGINMYVFMEEISKHLNSDSAVVTDAGSAVYVPAQGIKTSEKSQRYITSGAQAEMGFSLPASIGVSVAKHGKVIGITGDGSFQMNIQELQTIVHNKFPVKMFVWNNDGYLSIRATQNKFFNGRLIGTDDTSGVSFPEISKIAFAYGIKYVKMDSIKQMNEQFDEIMSDDEPVLCEVISIRDQLVIPSVSSKKMDDGRLVSKPIEDMFPFLPRDEFNSEMIVAPVEE